MEIINLSHVGLPIDEAREASKWIAKAFVEAPAEPALAIFFGTASYAENVKMHEAFWASHLNRVAKSGILLGARDGKGWRGFRCFFPPGTGWQPYSVDFDTGPDEDWATYLELTGKDNYQSRVAEWGRLTSLTQQEIGITTTGFYTTSIIVVSPEHQRKGIGRLLDNAAQAIVQANNGKLFVRIHEHILGFYLAQGYQVLASPTYTLGDVKPFKVHFLRHDGKRVSHQE